jgi:hypothetical protein
MLSEGQRYLPVCTESLSMPQHITDELWDLARRRYVFDLKPRTTIAQELDIDIFQLNARCSTENWETQREAVALVRTEQDENDPLLQHERVAESILRDIEVLRIALSNPDMDSTQAKIIRSRIESMRALSEAAASTIKVHREARGLKLGAPSATADTEEMGVRYTVSIPPAATVVQTG